MSELLINGSQIEKLCIGGMYKHYTCRSKKDYLKFPFWRRLKVIPGYYNLRCSKYVETCDPELIRSDDGAPIVMFLGISHPDKYTAVCKFISGKLIYYISRSELAVGNDQFEEITNDTRK